MPTPSQRLSFLYSLCESEKESLERIKHYEQFPQEFKDALIELKTGVIDSYKKEFGRLQKLIKHEPQT